MSFARKTPLTAEAASVASLIANGRDRSAWPAFATSLYNAGKVAYYAPDRGDERPVGLAIETTFRGDVIGKANDMVLKADDGVVDVVTASAFAAHWQEA